MDKKYDITKDPKQRGFSEDIRNLLFQLGPKQYFEKRQQIMDVIEDSMHSNVASSGKEMDIISAYEYFLGERVPSFEKSKDSWRGSAKQHLNVFRMTTQAVSKVLPSENMCIIDEKERNHDQLCKIYAEGMANFLNSETLDMTYEDILPKKFGERQNWFINTFSFDDDFLDYMCDSKGIWNEDTYECNIDNIRYSEEAVKDTTAWLAESLKYYIDIATHREPPSATVDEERWLAVKFGGEDELNF